MNFRAGAAEAETTSAAAGPDGSVEWSEPLEIILQDIGAPLVAVVQHSSSSPGGWSLVPGGHFLGAVITELPNEWRDVPHAPTAPTFYAQLSVVVEHSSQRDTRPPPSAGMDRKEALPHHENLSPTSSMTSSSTFVTSSVGGGFFPFGFDADPILSLEAPVTRRRQVVSTPARRAQVVPTPARRAQAMSMPWQPQRGPVSSTGWVPRGGDRHDRERRFHPNYQIPEYGGGTTAPGAATAGGWVPETASEQEALFESYALSRWRLDPLFPLEEEEEEKEEGKPGSPPRVEQVEREHLSWGSPTLKRESSLHSAAVEAADTEKRAEEVKTQHRSNDGWEAVGYSAGAAPSVSLPPSESPGKQKWFQRLKRSSSSDSTGSSSLAGSSSAAGSNETHPGRRRWSWASLTVSPAEADGGDRREQQREAQPPTAGRWKKAEKAARIFKVGRRSMPPLPPPPPPPGISPAVGGLAPAKEPIAFSCFAPPAVRPGTSFSLKVAAYLKRGGDTALRQALSEGETEAWTPEATGIARGRRMTVQLVRIRT